MALFYRNDRLYQIEGTAFLAGGHAEVDAGTETSHQGAGSRTASSGRRFRDVLTQVAIYAGVPCGVDAFRLGLQESGSPRADAEAPAGNRCSSTLRIGFRHQ